MTPQELNMKEAYSATLLRLNARAWGIAVGLVFGMGLFLATMVLLMKGGLEVGAHLGLLGKLLPGYSVTVCGAFIGFGYGFVIGYAIGYYLDQLFGTTYLRIVFLVLGVASGFISLVKELQKREKSDGGAK